MHKRTDSDVEYQCHRHQRDDVDQIPKPTRAANRCDGLVSIFHDDPNVKGFMSDLDRRILTNCLIADLRPPTSDLWSLVSGLWSLVSGLWSLISAVLGSNQSSEI